MEKNKLLGALGLARRAGALVAGYDSVKDALLAGSAHLVLCTADLSDGSRRRILRLAGELECDACALPLVMDDIAQLLHKPVGVLAVTDPNLAVLCRKDLPAADCADN